VLAFLAVTRQTIAAPAFDPLTDIDYGQIDFTIDGICECANPYDPVGVQFEYWEPFMVIDTSATAFYSAFLGGSLGGGVGGAGIGSFFETGKNKSQDTQDPGESTFAQAHGFLLPLMVPLCSRFDYGTWWSEVDPMWQSDLLTATIEPEAALFANQVSQLACMADATAVNVGFPLDELFWCIGSGGSAYPLTGRVADDNIIQANSTIAARLIYKLCRLFMICDPAMTGGCGCAPTPVWVKSHYKMAVVRPGRAGTYPLGESAMIYGANINIPFEGALGPEDQFMWVVYRKKICCTCCD
jgi:conjugal transfer pilus assembly protein TraU